MPSLRNSRRFHGDAPISLKALCLLERRVFPTTARDFIRGSDIRTFRNEVTAGDVECVCETMLWQNGFWAIRANFKDTGKVFGDLYKLELFAGSNRRALGRTIEGKVQPLFNKTETADEQGVDEWIRDNWVDVINSPVVATLTVAVDGWEIAAAAVGVVGVVAVGRVLFGGKKLVARQCDDSPFRNPDNRPCIDAAIEDGEDNEPPPQ